MCRINLPTQLRVQSPPPSLEHHAEPSRTPNALVIFFKTSSLALKEDKNCCNDGRSVEAEREEGMGSIRFLLLYGLLVAKGWWEVVLLGWSQFSGTSRSTLAFVCSLYQGQSKLA